MSSFRDWDLECKVYVGELGPSTEKDSLEQLFSPYGELRNVWVARSPPGFAFIEFVNKDDAEYAVERLDGTKFNNRTIRVEMSSGRPRHGRPGGRGGGGGGGGRDYRSNYGRRDYGRDDRRDRRRSRSYSPQRNRRRSRSRSPARRGRSRSRTPN